MTKGIDLRCKYKVSLRIRGLTKKGVDSLTKEKLKGFEYRVGSSYKNEEEKILVIPLNEGVTSKVLKRIIEASGVNGEYEFIVSTSNDNESFMIDIPPETCKLMHEVGGGITFSYTYSGGYE